MALVKTRPHYNVVFAVLLLGISAYALLQSMVVPVLSLLIPALHTDQNTATWLMTGYLLSASVATPILGRIGDKVGKERMLVVTLVALAVGSLLAALTDSIGVMIVARVIQGLGGGVIPLAFGIIRDEFPARKLHGAVGIASSLIAVGSGVGLVLAGPIVDHLNYHWLFWVPMIITTIAAVAAVLFVPESPVRSPGRINWGAALLLSAWLVALLLAVSKGPAWGWGSGLTLGLFALAIVTLIAWVVVELKSHTPLIDMRTMRIPAVWTTNLVAVLTGAAMYAMMTFLPQLLQTNKSVAGYGLSASITQSGLYMLPLSLAMFVIGLSIGPLAARISPKYIVLFGSLITIPAFALLALGHNHSWGVYLAGALLGIGIGLAFSSMPAIIVAAVPPAQTGAATGMNANVRTVGGAIGSAICSVILTSGAHTAHGLPADSSYSNVFWFLGGVSVLAAAAAVIVPAVRAHDPQAEVASSEPAAPAEVGDTAFEDALAGAGAMAAPQAVVAEVPYEGPVIGGRVSRENGRPVPDVALTLIDQRGHQVSRSATTSDGDYRIDAPETGSYVLIASSAGHSPVAVNVVAGSRPQRMDLTLPSSGVLSGAVHRAGDGEPIAGATVTLTDTRGEVVGAAVTAGDGTYVCRGVLPGTHTVVVVAERMRPNAATLTVPESGVLRYDAELESMAVLGGAVRAGERVVSNAQVSVLDPGGDLVATVHTDDDGRYQVPDLPAGQYVVVARGYPSVTTSVRVSDQVSTHDVELGYDDAMRLPVR
ncbi:EmrB/QacA subfamily drug resistance transporter [Nocardia transvalensis]|uniref:EmrB/QacA subfamily drug resistance transporter n=1 Tax=Nocardia transvalensis TaxID=37333 RepID=A0A7W9PF31_9NOCA|nr:MFS transporter [Nocardia transvalensis]MBB5914907.1 EmrB/QacA subfamily drug resistance transporter [Nocardia transvalensis]